MKESLSRRDFLKVSALGLGGLAVQKPEKRFGYPEIISSFETKHPLYALTIDDCWLREELTAMRDFLFQNGLTATFFPIGDAVFHLEYAQPGIMRSLVERGNSLGFHAMTPMGEQEYVELTDGQWRQEYRNYAEMMETFLGDLTEVGLKKYARAPSGIFTNDFLRFCSAEGLTPYWCNKGAGALERGERIHRGDILLLHVTPGDLNLLTTSVPELSGRLRGASIEWLDGTLDPTRLTHPFKNAAEEG